MTSELDEPRPDHSQETGSNAFRPDVEGLRAIAVILVMLYHARFPGFGGGYIGVDVFFVISGFLITGLIVRELERTGTVDLPRFYGRRIRRLLPAAALVLTSVAALTVLALPILRWSSTAKDVVGSALYLVNWRFASQAVDYLASGSAPSPVQHYWSLAVEEQFYLIWPVFLLLLASIAMRRNRPIRPSLALGLVVVGLPSFVWSIYLTAAVPGRAFFVSTTRAWELAAGGGLAIAAPLIGRLPRSLATWLALGGLVGILAASLVFNDATLFPGYAAALPVGAAVLVISAGVVDTGSFGARWLGIRPLAAIGTMSYSLYLWHWPLLVAADALPGPLRRRDSLAVVAISLIPAYLSYRFVEQRWRHADSFVTPPSRGLRYGLLLTAFGAAAGTALFIAVPESYFGVEALRPNPLNAMEDVANVQGDECDSETSSDALTCNFGLADSEIDVVLVGDSHAVQWIPAFEPLAISNSWSLTTMTKSGCQLADVVIAAPRTERPSSSCIEWNESVVSQLIDSKPDLVVATGIFWPTLIGPTGVLDDSEVEAGLTRGLERTWSTLSDAGIKVVAIRDVPHPPFDIAECVVENPLSPESCAFDRGGAMERNTPHVGAAEALRLGIIDLTDAICSATDCPAVKGDVLVWRDASHLTATYSAQLAGALEAKLLELAPSLAPISDS